MLRGERVALVIRCKTHSFVAWATMWMMVLLVKRSKFGEKDEMMRLE